MNKLNENIFHQYNKWKTGYIRKENGKKHKTIVGDVVLKGKVDHNDIVKFYYDLLDRDNHQLTYCVISAKACDIQPYEMKDLVKDQLNWGYIIKENKEDIYKSIIIAFSKYEELFELEYLDEDDCLFIEEDYYTLIEALALYLRENVMVDDDFQYRGYMVLSTGDRLHKKGCFEFMENKGVWGEFISLFERAFFSTPDIWNHENNIYVGVEYSYRNLKNYKSMKEFTEKFISDL